MKKNKVALLLGGLALLTACEQNKVTEISTEELLKNIDNPTYLIVDTRHDSLYNGFKDQNATKGGHIKGAIQFTTAWLDYIADDKFESFAKELVKIKRLFSMTAIWMIYNVSALNLLLKVIR